MSLSHLVLMCFREGGEWRKNIYFHEYNLNFTLIIWPFPKFHWALDHIKTERMTQVQKLHFIPAIRSFLLPTRKLRGKKCYFQCIPLSGDVLATVGLLKIFELHLYFWGSVEHCFCYNVSTLNLLLVSAVTLIKLCLPN